MLPKHFWKGGVHLLHADRKVLSTQSFETILALNILKVLEHFCSSSSTSGGGAGTSGVVLADVNCN